MYIPRFLSSIAVAIVGLSIPIASPLAWAADDKKPEKSSAAPARAPHTSSHSESATPRTHSAAPSSGGSSPSSTVRSNRPTTNTDNSGTQHGRSGMGNPSSTGGRTNTGASTPTGNAGRGWNQNQNQNQNVNQGNVGNTPRGFSGSGSGSGYGASRGSNGRVETYRSPNGSQARFRPDGSLHTVQARGMTITHGPAGSGRIMVQRPDRTVIVTNRNGHGYVQRPFAYQNREFVHRTYYVRGVAYSRYYQSYNYRGIALVGYVPMRYYSPFFYGWAFRPWGAPVYYSWGWGGSPWYGYYGGYFAPAPYYPSPSLWLVDYMISARLAEAYQDRAQAAAQAQAYAEGPGPGGQVGLNPEVKQAIADEVQRQLALENAEGQAMSRNQLPDPQSSGIPRLMSDNKTHVFVVSYNIDLIDSQGQSCTVTRGDVLRLNGAPPPDAQAALVQVIASKGNDCRSGSTVSVSLQDLQDLYNQMRESIDQGLAELQTKQGQGGLPAMPAAAKAAPVQAAFADIAPPPDPNVADELKQQVQEADRVEQEVVNEARSADSAPPQQEPTTIAIGQTTTEVLRALGNPRQIVNLGSKQIYVYPDMKITFIGGKVSDVQ